MSTDVDLKTPDSIHLFQNPIYKLLLQSSIHTITQDYSIFLPKTLLQASFYIPFQAFT